MNTIIGNKGLSHIQKCLFSKHLLLKPPPLLQSDPMGRLWLGRISWGDLREGFMADPKQQHSAQAQHTQLLLQGE